MHIQFLWHGFYPWEVRIEKFIDVFHEMGLDVGVLNRNVDNQPRTEIINAVKIQRIGSCNNLYSKVKNYPLFCNPVFLSKAERVIRQNQPKVIIVRDLPLGAAAIKIGKKMGIPTVLDMAENYPAALVSYQNPVYKPFLFADAMLPRMYEKYVIKHIDKIIVVADENANRLVESGAKSDKIEVIGNTSSRSFISSDDRSEKNDENQKRLYETQILYIGKIDVHRGIENLIRSYPLIEKKYPKAGIVLVGDGKQKKYLEDLTDNMGISKNVHFAGWVKHSQLPQYIKNSDICCIPHVKCEHTDTTLPNKLFDYMSFKKPILSSNLSPVMRIVKECGCGRIYESGNRDSLFRALVDLLEKSDLDKMGEKGHAAILQKYNWENDSKRLKKLFEELL